MDWVYILLFILGVLALVFFAGTYICFYIAFYSPRGKAKDSEEVPLPPGEEYVPYRDVMREYMKKARAMPSEEVNITSFDGLCLRGKYYELDPGAVVEVMMPGYRGTAERDLCGGVQRAFSVGHNVLVVDQRAGGRSEGHVITFGVREHRDCLSWVEYAIQRFGPQVRVMLAGVSMGAATVMIAGGRDLPENVIGIVADCGYTSARDIIKKVIRSMGLPADLLYPFVKLAGHIYGGFNVEEASPLEAMKRCRVPVFFAHGEEDDYVPCEMSRQLYAACTAPKNLFIVPGADHGLSYIVDPEGYKRELKKTEALMMKRE